MLAVKVPDPQGAEEETAGIQQEIAILSQCDSSYVTKCYGSYLKRSKLTMEDPGGGGSSLALPQAGPFDECPIATLLKEMLKGLHYLRSEKKIH